MKKIIPFILGVLFVFNSCKNDLDIVDDWKETMAVFGLLNPGDSLQYIKVNKAFLGREDAVVMAGNFDSLHYPPNALTVRLEKMLNGSVVQSILLLPDSAVPKDSGIFSNPGQYLYKTNTPVSGDGSEYRLTVINTISGLQAAAKTRTLSNMLVQTPFQNQSINLYGNTLYKTKWSTCPYGRLFNVTIRFHYRERFIFDTTQIAFKYIDIPFVNHKSAGLSGGENLSETVDPGYFFRVIGNNPKLPTNNLVERNFLSLEFIYGVAEEQFANYMEVVAAGSGSFNENPVYTNIENGIGLFSSRLFQTIKDVKLTANCIDSLMYGQFTGTKNFR